MPQASGGEVADATLALDFGGDQAQLATQREHSAAPESGPAAVIDRGDDLRGSSAEVRPTWSEAHRHACEVRYCLSRGRAWTIEYRIGVERHRGREAGDRLWRDVVKAAREARMNEGNDDAA